MRVIPFDQSFEGYCQMIEERFLERLKLLNNKDDINIILNEFLKNYLFESIQIFETNTSISQPLEIGLIEKPLNNLRTKNNKVKFIISIPFKGSINLFSIKLTNSLLMDFEFSDNHELIFKYFSCNECGSDWLNQFNHDLKRLNENVILWNNSIRIFNKKILEIIQSLLSDKYSDDYDRCLDGMRFKYYYNKGSNFY